MKSLLARLGASTLFSTFLAAQNVHVVDAANGPGAEFTSIQAAVEAATSGDVVLIRPGTYGGVVLGDKSLRLVRHQAGDSAPLVKSITISALAAREALVISGLTLISPVSASAAPLIDIRDCAGAISIESCRLAGHISIKDADNVVFWAAVLDEGYDPRGLRTAVPLGIQRSNVRVFDSIVAGLDGPSPGLTLATPRAGGPAIQMEDGELWLVHSGISGGWGSSGSPTGWCAGFDGGNGVVISGTNPRVFLIGNEPIGGRGGRGARGCTNGTDGLGFQRHAGNVVRFPEFPRRLYVNSPQREGETAQIVLSGMPGDRVFLAVSRTPGVGRTLAHVVGPLLVGAPLQFFTAGELAGMSATFPLPIHELGSGIESRGLYVQALVLNTTSGEMVLSNPVSLLMLDQAF